MNFKIIDTGAEKQLKLVDPKSGIDWLQDLMGNATDLELEVDDETGYYLITQEDYRWWLDLVNRYQAADNRYYELTQSISDHLRDDLVAAVNNIDEELGNFPDALNDVCDKFEQKDQGRLGRGPIKKSRLQYVADTLLKL